MKVIKRNDSEQDFCLDKIINAVKKANMSVPEADRMDETAIQKVVSTVQKKLEGFNTISVEDIQDLVENSLIRHNKALIAKNYILYRNDKKNKKKFTPSEEKALSLLNGTSELRGDNANKHIDDNGSLRDYFAGLLCKSIANKILPKKITEAHNKGLIHYHDFDYSPVMPMHNCFLGSQKFITERGIERFDSYKDGDKVMVKDKNGVTREATVHTYGKQKMYEIVLKYGTRYKRSIYCTENHGWFLIDGTKTNKIKVGDKLILNKTYLNNNLNIDSIDDARMWCLGFIIGDGCDHMCSNTLHTQVRLCGKKNEYINNFKKAGYRIKIQYGDYVPYIKGISKQDFLESKSWRFLNERQKAFLFLGLMAADGRNNGKSIASSDNRVIDLIYSCAGMANYFITSSKKVTENTNFKDNREITYISFLSPQVDKYCFKVESIKPYAKGIEKIAYCVEEPITHSFTLEGGVITSNCDLLNIEDMFANGFQMGTTKIEPNDETPFRTICNLLSQISLIVSGRQYGGQTVSWAHTLPYINNSRKLIRKEFTTRNWFTNLIYNKLHLMQKYCSKKVEEKLRQEIAEGVKIYQYQILCHSSSNGQTPFVSNNLCLREAETEQELKDFALLIEEIFKRRIKGVKDKTGHYVSPLFPKLLYWECEGLNVNPTDPYYYLNELAAECEIKRMQPDINSEKECRRIKEGQIIPSMGCRSLLGPIWEETKFDINTSFYWVDAHNIDGVKQYPYGTFVEKRTFKELPNGKYKSGYDEGEFVINFRGNTGWLLEKDDNSVTVYMPKTYGRFNQGVVTINLPHVALEANGDIKEFYKLLDERLELCREALKTRNESVKKIKAFNSEILWMHGALSRMNSGETVGDLMEKYPKRASISLGYAGLYETCRALIHESNTSEKGIKLSKEVLEFMNKKCKEWKEQDNLNYSIYGTPEESLTSKFATANRRDFGVIEYITDKDYVVNSYHVDPREHIDAFKKLEVEGQYLALSSGGAVSYVETFDLKSNKKAILNIMRWMYDHILYAEFNRKIGICHNCGYEGDIDMIKTENGDFIFKCPKCGNTDDNKMDITARLCGYLGKINAGNTNKGRLDDIHSRVTHLDCVDEKLV